MKQEDINKKNFIKLCRIRAVEKKERVHLKCQKAINGGKSAFSGIGWLLKVISD